VGAVAPRAAEPTAAPADGNVAAVSHADRCSCLSVNAAVSKPAWWPWHWKWYPSHVWRGLPVCQFWSS